MATRPASPATACRWCRTRCRIIPGRWPASWRRSTGRRSTGRTCPGVLSVPGDCPFLPPDLVARLHAAREAAGVPLACARLRRLDASADRPVAGRPARRAARRAAGRRAKIDRWTARFGCAACGMADRARSTPSSTPMRRRTWRRQSGSCRHRPWTRIASGRPRPTRRVRTPRGRAARGSGRPARPRHLLRQFREGIGLGERGQQPRALARELARRAGSSAPEPASPGRIRAGRPSCDRRSRRRGEARQRLRPGAGRAAAPAAAPGAGRSRRRPPGCPAGPTTGVAADHPHRRGPAGLDRQAPEDQPPAALDRGLHMVLLARRDAARGEQQVVRRPRPRQRRRRRRRGRRAGCRGRRPRPAAAASSAISVKRLRIVGLRRRRAARPARPARRRSRTRRPARGGAPSASSGRAPRRGRCRAARSRRPAGSADGAARHVLAGRAAIGAALQAGRQRSPRRPPRAHPPASSPCRRRPASARR